MLAEQRQLIQQLATGDAEASNDFVRRWQDRILHWTVQHSSRDQAEEYAQEVWQHLMENNWRRLLKWRPLYDDAAWHEHSLASFLRTITINKVRDLVDAEPPVSHFELDPNDIIDRTTSVGWNPQLEAERARMIAAYDFCAEFFRAEDHLALSLWHEGHDAGYIAAHLGTNANNVYQRRSYLFKRLRDCLRERLPEYFGHE